MTEEHKDWSQVAQDKVAIVEKADESECSHLTELWRPNLLTSWMRRDEILCFRLRHWGHLLRFETLGKKSLRSQQFRHIKIIRAFLSRGAYRRWDVKSGYK